MTTPAISASSVPAVHFRKAALIGVGLIGGSLAAAMKQHGLCDHIVGLGRTLETVLEAKKLGLIDHATTDYADLKGCDLIVLCVPVAQTAATLRALLPFVTPSTLITDTGSTKQDVVYAARSVLGDESSTPIAQFIPAHPIAGKAQHGPAAAEAGLFQGRRVVLTPLPENTMDMVDRVAALWAAVGAEVSHMSAIQHDAVFSSVSHLPHLLAYALVAQIANSEDAATKLGYAGAGFRDFTRIAASSPEMWRDVFAANKTAVLKDLRAYQAMLAQMELNLVTGDTKTLEKILSRAATVRSEWGKASE